jgi:steroid delta-isomerase-like uncharacterized protein
MQKAKVTELLNQQILSLWGGGDLTLVEKNYSLNVIDHMPVPGQPSDRDALREVVADFRQAIPDLSMTLHGTIVCGDTGVDFWTLEGTHNGSFLGMPPTGRRVSFSGIDMIRVTGDQITDIWHVEEMLQFTDQIGQSSTVFGVPLESQLGCRASSDASRADYDPGRYAHVPPADTLSPLEQRNLGIARDHIENLWARGDMTVAYRLYAPDVVDHQPAPEQRLGIDGIVDVLGWLREAVPNLSMEIAQYVVDGNLAADRWIMRGTHTGAPLMGMPALNKSFEINGMDVIRIRDDGLISDVWHVEEFSQLRAQISA